MATRYWFKPKRYGYGATPVTWEGWALTLAGIAVVFATCWHFLNLGEAPSDWQLVTWALTIVATLAALAIVSHRKTDGAWRWRWGSDPDRR